VSFFIEHFALSHNFSQERVSFFQSPRNVLGRANDQVERELRLSHPADFYRLVDRVSRWHHDENIHIAVLVWLPVGMGAEEDDLFRVELLRHIAREAPDDRHGDVGAAIPARNPVGH
jgi:hypothetical protein